MDPPVVRDERPGAGRASARHMAGRPPGAGAPPASAPTRRRRQVYSGWASTMIRSSVISSIAQRSPSRPRPESFTPP